MCSGERLQLRKHAQWQNGKEHSWGFAVSPTAFPAQTGLKYYTKNEKNKEYI